MQIKLIDGFLLSPLVESYRDDLVEHLAEKAIYAMTLAIPYLFCA